MNEIDRGRGSLLEDLAHWANEKPDSAWLVEKWQSREQTITWRDGAEKVRNASAWLADRFPEPGTKIGHLSRNCAHWVVADLAIMAAGHIHVPLFTTMRADTFVYAADFAGIDMLLLGPAENWDAVKHVLPPDLPVVRMPEAPAVKGALEWSDILAEGVELPAAAAPDVRAPATIVFTSGTTGRPKGVVHSLDSLRAAGYDLGHESGTHAGSRFLSYLPLPHLGERIVVEFNSLPFGGSIYFAEGVDTFLTDLRNARPTWFLGVPRIWEKLQQGIHAYVAAPDEIAAAGAEELGDIGRKAREFLGLDAIEFILTSTAPTPEPLKEWYERLGIVLCEGYGQSEILPITLCTLDSRRAGSTGRPARGVEIRIAEDGEIQSRAPGTALGYYERPDLTAATFEPDGWVHTGDRGYLDKDGFLYITGRVKEIFKTGRGKYVAPAPIEGRFAGTPLVEQVCLTGAGLAQTVMIAVLLEAAADAPDDEIGRTLLDRVASLNDKLDKHERIGSLILTRTSWTQENGILTHTLKMKRDAVEDRYAAEIAVAGERMRDGETGILIWA